METMKQMENNHILIPVRHLQVNLAERVNKELECLFRIHYHLFKATWNRRKRYRQFYK